MESSKAGRVIIIKNRASLIRVNLEGAKLKWGNLTKANLSGAKLTGANLIGANLTDTNLGDAQSVQGTDLRKVKGLTREQLDLYKARGAIIDEDTQAIHPNQPFRPLK